MKYIFLCCCLLIMFLKTTSQCSTPVTLPYFNGFENEVAGQTPQCFTIQYQYSTGFPIILVTDSIHPFEGFKKLLITGDDYLAADYNVWIFLPAMDFDSSKKYYLSFQYRGYNNKVSNEFPFRVFYGNSPAIPAMTNFLGNTTYWPNIYTPFSSLLSKATGINYIGIYYQYNPDGGNALYIDNISVSGFMPSHAPICPSSNTYFVSGSSSIGNMYKWQADTGSGFTDLHDNATYNGTSADTLQLIAPSTDLYGTTYRCIINGNTYTTPNTLKFAVTWKGSANAAWENPANWSCGILPDANTDVIIDRIPPVFYFLPVVSTNTACGSLQLRPGAYVRVKAGAKLELKRRN